MSALGQQRTHAPQQTVSLFDYIVGELSELHRHIQAERFGGLEVDHQLELGRGLDGKLAPLRMRSAYDAARRYSSIESDP
jgi:hypothetical protein